MKNKKAIFTESQIKYIYGKLGLNEEENAIGAVYLDKTDNGSDVPDGIPYNLGQISTDTGSSNDPLTTDKFEVMHKQNVPYGGFRRGIKESYKKKLVNEVQGSNNFLDNKYITFNALEKQELQNVLKKNTNGGNVDGYDAIKNWLENGKISYEAARKEVERFDKGKSIVPKHIMISLKQKLGAGRTLSKLTNDANASRLSQTNKTPQNKISGNNKTHHTDGEQTNNGGTIHYF